MHADWRTTVEKVPDRDDIDEGLERKITRHSHSRESSHESRKRILSPQESHEMCGATYYGIMGVFYSLHSNR